MAWSVREMQSRWPSSASILFRRAVEHHVGVEGRPDCLRSETASKQFRAEHESLGRNESYGGSAGNDLFWRVSRGLLEPYGLFALPGELRAGRSLLPDAEPAEDLSKKIFAREIADEFAKGPMGKTQALRGLDNVRREVRGGREIDEARGPT